MSTLAVRTARALRTLALAGAGLGASAPWPDGASAIGSASLTVDVYQDLGGPGVSATREAPERVELVVDLTRSMLRGTQGGRSLADLARSGAAAQLDSLDDSVEVGLTVFGHAAGEPCTEAERILVPAPSASRQDAAERLRELEPRSEASLAGAIDHVRRDLERERGARRVRVVAVTDLDEGPTDPCGGDLCAAARRLVAAGAWIEIVPTRDVASPACLAELVPSPAQPAASSSGGAGGPPSFSVASNADGAPVVAEGRAGAGAVLVPPGLLTLLVHLDPPEQIGPFRLGPGESARVSVLESFESGVPTRIWRIERGDEAVGRAFPPPDKLPRER